MHESEYKNDFEKFLAHTNEKDVLAREIGADIVRFKINSILDIGAGNGLMNIPLSKRVDTYTAVEQNPIFVEKLAEAGINVIEAHFPVHIEGAYDLVLVSHATSYKEDSFEPFVRAGWNLVAPHGRLLIITYRGQEDDWTELMKQIRQPTSDSNRIGYNRLVELLFSLGEVKVRKVTTTVQTDNIDDMVDALSFVASDGNPERKAEFLKQTPKD